MMLGDGTFGHVVQRGNLAVKIIKLNDRASLMSAWREIIVTALMNHPNIIQIERVHIGIGEIEIHMPLYECDLVDWSRKYQTTLGVMQKIYRQIAMGLQYIHASEIIHADIKPGNILLRGTVAVISDFGIAVPGGENRFRHNNVQTIDYRAPEVASGNYSYPIDCWSLGIIIAELSFGINKPTADDDRIPSTPLGNLCRKLLSGNPARRATAAECVSVLSRLCRVAGANYVPAPVILRPLEDLPILKNAKDYSEKDAYVTRFANRLFEFGRYKKEIRDACYYLTSCVYNFSYIGGIDASQASKILPGLRITTSV